MWRLCQSARTTTSRSTRAPKSEAQRNLSVPSIIGSIGRKSLHYFGRSPDQQTRNRNPCRRSDDSIVRLATACEQTWVQWSPVACQ